MSFLLSMARKYREKKNMVYNLFRFVPDEQYLKIIYRIRMGKRLDLQNPKSFNEKLQWLKLNNRKPCFITMVDKYEAKEYASSIIGEEFIIPTLGVWDSFDEINFDELPNQFVLKCTHDSGGLVICKDKKTLNKAHAKRKIEQSLKCNFYYVGREWPYKDVKPRIIAEQYMEEAGSSELKDYKLYCFNGEPKFLYLSEGLSNHNEAKISFVNLDWTLAKYKRNDYKAFDTLPKKPVNLDKMILAASKLSEGIPFLRVDFYEINGKMFFGELTFFPGSGFTPFASEEDDIEIGTLLTI